MSIHVYEYDYEFSNHFDNINTSYFSFNTLSKSRQAKVVKID